MAWGRAFDVETARDLDMAKRSDKILSFLPTFSHLANICFMNITFMFSFVGRWFVEIT